jgi:hypothetical protein
MGREIAIESGFLGRSGSKTQEAPLWTTGLENAINLRNSISH